MTEPANRQAALMQRLRASGGDRISVNLPADLNKALRLRMAASGQSLTDIVVEWMRAGRPAQPMIRADVPFGPPAPVRAEIRRRLEFWGPHRPATFTLAAMPVAMSSPAVSVTFKGEPPAPPPPPAQKAAPRQAKAKPAPKRKPAARKPNKAADGVALQPGETRYEPKRAPGGNLDGLTWHRVQKDYDAAQGPGAKLHAAMRGADLYRVSTEGKFVGLTAGPCRDAVIAVLVDSCQFEILSRIEAHTGENSDLAQAWDAFCGVQGPNVFYGPQCIGRAFEAFAKWLQLGTGPLVPGVSDLPALFHPAEVTHLDPKAGDAVYVHIPAELWGAFDEHAPSITQPAKA